MPTPQEEQVIKRLIDIYIHTYGSTDVDTLEKMLKKLTETTQTATSKIDLLSNKIYALKTGLSQVVSPLTTFSGLLGASIPSLSSIIEKTFALNKNILSSTNAFTKYGVGLSQTTAFLNKMTKEVNLTREESMRLMKIYENNTLSFSLQNASKLFSNLKNIAGSNVEVMEQYQNVLNNIIQKFPDLEQNIIRLNEADKRRLNNLTSIFLLTGRMNLQEAKRFREYTSQGKQFTDKDDEQRQLILKQIKIQQDLKIGIENIALSVGNGITNWLEHISGGLTKIYDWIAKNGTFYGSAILAALAAKTVGDVLSGISKISGAFGGSLGGVGKGLIGAGSGIGAGLLVDNYFGQGKGYASYGAALGVGYASGGPIGGVLSILGKMAIDLQNVDKNIEQNSRDANKSIDSMTGRDAGKRSDRVNQVNMAAANVVKLSNDLEAEKAKFWWNRDDDKVFRLTSQLNQAQRAKRKLGSVSSGEASVYDPGNLDLSREKFALENSVMSGSGNYKEYLEVIKNKRAKYLKEQKIDDAQLSMFVKQKEQTTDMAKKAELEGKINNIIEKRKALNADEDEQGYLDEAIVKWNILVEAQSKYTDAIKGTATAYAQQSALSGKFDIKEYSKYANEAVSSSKAELQQAKTSLQIFENKRKEAEKAQKEAESQGKDSVEYQKATETLSKTNIELNTAKAELQTKELSQLQRQWEVLQGIETAYAAQKNYLQAAVQQQEILINIADNMGAGLKASVEQRQALVGSIQNQINTVNKELQDTQTLLKDNSLDENAALAAKTKIKNLENERLQLMQKQVEVTKELREGYVDAIRAMTAGTGMFTKMMVDQDKNLGFSIRTLGVLGGMRAGGFRKDGGAAGWTTASQYGIGGMNYGMTGQQQDMVNGTNPAILGTVNQVNQQIQNQLQQSSNNARNNAAQAVAVGANVLGAGAYRGNVTGQNGANSSVNVGNITINIESIEQMAKDIVNKFVEKLNNAGIHLKM